MCLPFLGLSQSFAFLLTDNGFESSRVAASGFKTCWIHRWLRTFRPNLFVQATRVNSG